MLSTRNHFFILLLATLVLVGCPKRQPDPVDADAGVPTLGIPMPTAEELAALGPENSVPVHRLLPNPFFVVAGKPKQLLASPLSADGELLVRGNIAAALYLDYFGIDPNTVESFVQSNGFPVSAVMSIPNPQNPMAPPLMQHVRIARQATLITFAEPYELAALFGVDEIDPILLGQLRRTEGANEYYDVTPPGEIVPQRIALGLLDARTIVIVQGVDADIREVFSDDTPKSALLERLKHTPVDINDLTLLTSLEGLAVSPEEFEQFIAQVPEIPADVRELITGHLRALTLSLTSAAAQGQPVVSIRIEGRDVQSAALIGEQIELLIILGETMLATLSEEAKRQLLPFPEDFAALLLRALSVDTEGTQVHVVLHNFETLIPTLAGWIGDQQAVLQQAQLQEQRELLYQWRTNQLNGLAEISVMYYMEHGKFPSDILDAEGKPLLSWRVALLPTMGLEHLYNQFKRDEPWDSEANLAAQQSMPSIFLAHTPDVEPFKTVIRFFDSPGTPFSNRDLRSETLAHPQTTLMYLVVSPEYAVEWTKPEPLEFDLDKITEILDESSLGISFARRVALLPVPKETDSDYDFQKQFIEALVKGLPLPPAEEMQESLQEIVE